MHFPVESNAIFENKLLQMILSFLDEFALVCRKDEVIEETMN